MGCGLKTTLMESVSHRARWSNGDVALTQHCKLLLRNVLQSGYGGAVREGICTNLAMEEDTCRISGMARGSRVWLSIGMWP